MKRTKWVWFLSGGLKSWDLLSLSLTAKELVQNGEELTILSQGGIYPGTFGNIISWNSLGVLDKTLWLSCRGSLWHLWGDVPSWWPLIKARATTVHSLRGSTDWQGHPVFISANNKSVDRNALVPAFEKDLVWGHPGETNRNPVVIALCPSVMSRPDRMISDILQGDLKMPLFKVSSHSGLIPGSGTSVAEEDILPIICKRGGVLVLTGIDQSLAILSGFAAMYGVPTIAPWTPLLDKMLGAEGYISIPAEKQFQEDVISKAMGDYGKKIVTFARHRLEEFFSPEISGENIRGIYKNLGGKSF